MVVVEGGWGGSSRPSVTTRSVSRLSPISRATWENHSLDAVASLPKFPVGPEVPRAAPSCPEAEIGAPIILQTKQHGAMDVRAGEAISEAWPLPFAREHAMPDMSDEKRRGEITQQTFYLEFQ